MRIIPSAVQTEINTGTAVTRTLIKLNLDSPYGPLYYTNHHLNISFDDGTGSHTYVSYRLAHGNIRTFLENKVDNLSFEIDNVDRAQSALFGDTDFQGRYAEVWKVFLNKSTGAVIGGFRQFKGTLDQPTINLELAQHKIVNIFDRTNSVSPWKRWVASCWKVFKSSDCGFSGTGTACDKSYGACRTYHNVANFGGFPFTPYVNPHIGMDLTIFPTTNDQYLAEKYRTINRLTAPEDCLPIVYGEATLPCAPIAWGYNLLPAGIFVTAAFGICEGEIDSLTFMADGVPVSKSSAYTYQERLGTNSQMVSEISMQGWNLPDSFLYFHGTAFVVVKSLRGVNETAYQQNPYYFRDLINPNIYTQNFSALVRGIKVQKYTSGGAPSGSPVWSDNPVWCLIDFLMNRASKKLTADLIDWSVTVPSANYCDTIGYKCSLTLVEQSSDTDIITKFLNSCRGYITYASGQMRINVEQAGSPVHDFDDAGTADNICSGSFEYYKNPVNDVPNKIIVQYRDNEVRETSGLISANSDGSGNVAWGASSFYVGDIKGPGFGTSGAKTFYIAGVSCTGTWNGSTQFTGCSWGTRPAGVQTSLPSGYPVFGGKQTFLMLTAIYNDEANQTSVNRVIEKQIDGSAIPTYRQAYWVAEYIGKKAVVGNLYCKFRGQMDSLKLETGDLCRVTHTLPGWNLVPFRIIQAEESESEEITYTCQFYDASFYTQGGSVGITPGGDLPNSNDVMPNVTSLALEETGFIDVGTGSSVPAINVTYTTPASIFYGWSRVDINVNNAGWINYGLDYSYGTGYTIDGVSGRFVVGDSVSIRVIAVSQTGIMADGSTAPTQTIAITGAGSIPTPTPVTGLQLIQGGSVWDGLSFGVKWTVQGDNVLDPAYIQNEVVIQTGGITRGTFYTRDNSWVYSYGNSTTTGTLDASLVSSNGSCTVQVTRISTAGVRSTPQSIGITNKRPWDGVSDIHIQSRGYLRGAEFQWDACPATDFRCYQVREAVGGVLGAWMDTEANRWKRNLTQTEINNGGEAQNIGIEVRAVDIWGLTSSNSWSISATTQGFPPMDATNIPEGYNLIVDGDFEYDLTNWVLFGGTAGTVRLLTSGSKIGNKALENATNAYTAYTTEKFLPVSTERSYSLEAYLRTVSGSGTATLQIKCYAQDKITLLATIIAVDSFAPPPSFSFSQGAFGNQIDGKGWPSGCAYIKPVLMLNTTAVATVQQIQGVRLREIIESAWIHDLAVTEAKIANLAVTNAKINDLSADKINAGSIRGINVNAGSHTTKGSYLLSPTQSSTLSVAANVGATTLTLVDASYFPTAGSGRIWPLDQHSSVYSDINWTNKTGNQLTGVTGVGFTCLIGSYVGFNGHTITLKNADDFELVLGQIGYGFVIDTFTDWFTFTGITATTPPTLTGCSAVHPHASERTVIPQAACIVMDSETHEIRVYANPNAGDPDTTAQEVCSIGRHNPDRGSDWFVIDINTASQIGLHAKSTSGNPAAFIEAVSDSHAMWVQNRKGTFQGYGAYFDGWNAPIVLAPNMFSYDVTPTHNSSPGAVMVAGGASHCVPHVNVSPIGTGTGWKSFVGACMREIGPFTPASNGYYVQTHGFGANRVIIKAEGWLKCISADAGYSVGQWVQAPDYQIYYDNTYGYSSLGVSISNLPSTSFFYVRMGSGISAGTNPNPFVVPNLTTGVITALTNAKWELYIRLWV